jgi:hypothetical protein
MAEFILSVAKMSFLFIICFEEMSYRLISLIEVTLFEVCQN